MKSGRPALAFLALCAALLWSLGRSVRAERIGRAYRGPIEQLTTSSADDDDDESTPAVPGGETGTEPGGGGSTEPGGGGSTEPGGGSGTSDPGGGRGGGKTAVFDGKRLWNWWWEHNKDRFLARATVPGRVHAGSAYYWFGGGAKFPPRNISPISEPVKNTQIFPALLKALRDGNIAVRTEACIALGRLGNVPAGEKEKKKDQSSNLVVRALKGVLNRRATTTALRELRNSAILGLGISGDPDGATYLMRNVWKESSHDVEQAYILIALGLARSTEAIQLIADHLPRDARRKPQHSGIAAIHAMGLMGPGALAELKKAGVIQRLTKLANRRGSQDVVIMQSVAALGRLRQSFKAVRAAFGSKSKDVQYTAVLAMANYGVAEGDTDETKAAAKFLMAKAYKSGEGKIKNFSVFAAGDLASRLDPNSPIRDRLLKHLRGAVEKKDTYLRSCAAVALGVANDRTAVDVIAKALRESNDTNVVAAMCMGLGLLRDTNDADLIRDRVMLQTRWGDDNRGGAAMGLALTGDTTRIDELRTFHNKKGLNPYTKRYTPLAIGILGGQDEVKDLIAMFARPWEKQDLYAVSQAVFALSWLRDQNHLDKIVELTRNPNAKVRGMAAIALGHLGARDRVDPLTRCFENMSQYNRFRWGILWRISRIL